MKEEIQKTLANIYWDAIGFCRTHNQTVGENNDYFLTLSQLNSLLKDACPAECHTDPEYGFVPEAGCPIHD